MNLGDKLDEILWDASIDGTKKDKRLAGFLMTVLEAYDDLWAESNKVKFGNDGIDYKPWRLMAA